MNTEYDSAWDFEEQGCYQSSCCDNEQDHSSPLKCTAALFLLKTKVMGRVSQDTWDTIIGDLIVFNQA